MNKVTDNNSNDCFFIKNIKCNYRLGGLVLSKAADVPGFSVFQPIINGIGGNLVSVQASRISSTLHQTSLMGVIPEFTKLWISPWKALFKGGNYSLI